MFKSYFKKNLFWSVPQCVEYAHGKLWVNIIINENIKSKIHHAKSSINITQKNKEIIIELINNLKDKNNNPISYCYQYENINKKKEYII